MLVTVILFYLCVISCHKNKMQKEIEVLVIELLRQIFVQCMAYRVFGLKLSHYYSREVLSHIQLGDCC